MSGGTTLTLEAAEGRVAVNVRVVGSRVSYYEIVCNSTGRVMAQNACRYIESRIPGLVGKIHTTPFEI